MIALTERQKSVYDALVEVTKAGTVDHIGGRFSVAGLFPSWVNHTLVQLDHAGVVQIIPKGGKRRFRLLVLPDEVRVASAEGNYHFDIVRPSPSVGATGRRCQVVVPLTRRGRMGKGQSETKITAAMISRVARTLLASGSLVDPPVGVACLSERLLRRALLPRRYGAKDSAIDAKPSRTAVRLDKYL